MKFIILEQEKVLSVLEVVNTFEEVSGVKLNYSYC